MVESKACSTCRQVKSADAFYRRPDSSTGLASQCKECVSARNRLTQDRKRAYNKAYVALRHEELKEKQRQYHAANRDARNAKHREYAKANAARIQRQNQDWKNAKRKSDPLYALRMRIKNRIKAAFRKAGYRAGTQTQQILGCSYEKFKRHLESYFQPGMSWANRGEWHIDHHVPLASAKAADDLLALNRYTNLRPLWALDNIRKRAAMPDQYYGSAP
jgi:uncharacterized protein YdiU (UPF0061 family)